MPGTLLIGYDVEWTGSEAITATFLQQASELHHRLDAPATMFVVGRTLERWLPEFRVIAADPLFDLQQHTYSHQLLKTVCIDNGRTMRVVRGVTPEQTREEIRKTTELLREQIGVECIGLTGPWCYYRGLRDRPDILAVLWDEGIRFCRTDGRNERDYHPVSIDLQPYWYEAAGFPEILEIPIHGWHDCEIRENVLGWADLVGYVASVTPYLDRAADENKVFSLCQHDWSSIREDPELRATEAIIRYARRRGLQIMTYQTYYEQSRLARSTEDRSRLHQTEVA